jgi:predicted PurR-regulated permease PerM
MKSVPRTGVWIIATGVIMAGLHFGRDILAPFALALFLFLVMEGLAGTIDKATHGWGSRLGRLLSIVLVLAGFGAFIVMMARGVAQFSNQADLYEARIDDLIRDVYGALSLTKAPTLSGLVTGETGQRLFTTVAGSVGDLSENIVLILIYVAFLYLASSAWSAKVEAMFPESEQRRRVDTVLDQSRRAIVTYLWTQTVISALITALTYGTLLIMGVENALFLAGLIFVLNYIPTLGSIVAAIVPPLFALVQPEAAWPAYMPDSPAVNAALVFAGVSLWQFAIGNFLQPRMMGESLNLSALVVLLGLAIWGALWGVAGMFLSAPLTVVLMVALAQSRQTYWIAVLLSANGQPGPDPRRPVPTEAPAI